LDGFISIESLVASAKDNCHRSVGLTDHGTFSGAIQFVKECRKQEIRPVLGMEAYMSRDHSIHSKKEQPEGQKGNRHLNLFAKNYKGYQNLCTLSQIASLDGFYYKPRIDINLLAKYREGLIVSSACINSVINYNLTIDRYEKAKKAATIFKDIFGEDFYLEIMYHGIDKEAKIIPDIQKISKELDIKTIITNDTHYPQKKDAKYHSIILCLRDNKNSCIKDPNRFRFSSEEFYFKSTEEMFEIFKSLPKSMKNTVELAEKCDLSELQFGEMRLPKFDIPEQFGNPHEYLCHLAKEGLKSRNLEDKKEYVDQLNLELSDLKLIFDTKKYDFSTYFLIVEDIIRFIKEKQIPYDIRGSGNSSVLLHVLKISKIDPVAYQLRWERFLGFSSKRTIIPSDFGINS